MTKQKSSVSVKVVDLFAEDAVKMLGIREAKEGEGGFSYTKEDGTKGKFVIAKNRENRPFSLGLAETYAKQMFEGRWAGQKNSSSKTGNGEAWIFDKKGNVVSCAHRGTALWLAETQRKRMVFLGMGETLDELGIDGPICLPDVVVVERVDSQAADTNDTGKNRSLGDVFYRKGLFSDKALSESELKQLATTLSVAVKHVWLRTNGWRVAGGPKLLHPDGVAVLERHPLLLDCVAFVHKLNKGSEDNKRPLDKFGFSLGYIAAHIYLAAFQSANYERFASKEMDMGRRPSKETWEATEEFWRGFSQTKVVGKEKTPSAVWSLYNVLEASNTGKQRLDRDGLCTVVTRAMSRYLDDPKEEVSAKALRHGLLGEKGTEGEVVFERFGGLDLDRAVLVENGWVEEVDIKRQSVESWKVGDTYWVVPTDKETKQGIEPWFGTIEAFSDDGTQTSMFSADDQSGGIIVGLGQLRADKPSGKETEGGKESGEGVGGGGKKVEKGAEAKTPKRKTAKPSKKSPPKKGPPKKALSKTVSASGLDPDDLRAENHLGNGEGGGVDGDGDDDGGDSDGEDRGAAFENEDDEANAEDAGQEALA